VEEELVVKTSKRREGTWEGEGSSRLRRRWRAGEV
jgi:hypothetical protein